MKNRVKQLNGKLTPKKIFDWVNTIVKADLLWHFDDSPDSIIDFKSGLRVFTDEEAMALGKSLANIYRQGYEIWDFIRPDGQGNGNWIACYPEWWHKQLRRKK